MQNMKLRNLCATTLLVLCLTSLVACNGLNRSSSGALAGRLQVLHRLDKDGRPRVAARVVDISTGRELYAENADEPMIPASNLKLFVATAALDFFGPDHAFKTYLALDGDDLWIIGTGDPGVGDDAIAGRRTTKGRTMTVLEDWSRALKSRGVSRINGKLYYYDGAFEAQQVHPTWDEDDLPNWYAAPVGGLNFNDNCIDITVYPTEPGQPVRFEVVPPVQGIRIVNNCITGAEGEPDCERALKENVYTLKGGCAKKTALKSKPVTNPGAFFADALREQLKKDGIEVAGPVERVSEPLGGTLEPPADKVVAVHQTTMRELLPRINKNSQNLLAEGLCKLLGRGYDLKRGRDVPGSWASGSEAIHAFLQRQGINGGRIVIADGSGLSRDNRVTTRAISDLLVKMRSDPHGDVLFDSLSIGGVDGTIRSRYTDRPGVVHAKTGYIGGVRSLSGYVPSQRGEIVFSFIYNRIPGQVKPYEELQDYAVRTLMSWPDLDYVPPPSTQPATAPARQSAPVAAGD
jgi:D-alanyl-D-alanine carboxypeptidase/D-alanyl-D-alanine-endopeptidase (penicillin-binding protein 4)